MSNSSTRSTKKKLKITKDDASESSNPDTSSSSSKPTKQPAKEKKKISRLRTGRWINIQNINISINKSTGCWTCRRRGYKCDEGKPFCHNCTRLNLQCEGYGIRLKWQDDSYFRQHNKAKGRGNSGMFNNTVFLVLHPCFSFFVVVFSDSALFKNVKRLSC